MATQRHRHNHKLQLRRTDYHTYPSMGEANAECFQTERQKKKKIQEVFAGIPSYPLLKVNS
jgi:hypothetical protein